MSQRINRNILECKGSVFLQFRLLLGVLIETYWNVKEDELQALTEKYGY